MSEFSFLFVKMLNKLHFAVISLFTLTCRYYFLSRNYSIVNEKNVFFYRLNLNSYVFLKLLVVMWLTYYLLSLTMANYIYNNVLISLKNVKKLKLDSATKS